ncbi:hypothetical protein ECC02_011459 [Trypanosoma cruzi]|uniref:Uncharacterized protein n=1 Tax=Trypanosoma cruzi TaxID=5693 RepID=A0A7J6XMS5_TRYCR|nr:hypothetical protein ECC02_011459 [Trypanosoma cruzi]
MLSRVAAVKAPRTHNRRRVTGSSGRRREGRESEPQRPNMSRRVFTSAVLLLLFVMMCCGSGVVAQAGVEEQSSGPTFQWKAITDGVTVDSLDVPGLLKVGSDVFAVAEAQCKKGGDSFTGIASQLLTMDKGNEPEEVLKDAKDTQFLEEVTSPEGKKRVGVSRPTTAVKGSDIYMLVGKYNRNDAQDSGEGDLGLLLVKGEVGEGSNNQIRWKTTDGVPCTLGDQQNSLKRLIGGGGSGVKLKDGTLLFPVEGIKKEREGTGMDGKAVSLILYSSDTPSCTLSKEVPDGGCSDPSVVEWKGKLMMMTACDDGRRRVYESGDKGDSWTEALGTLSRVWGNRRDGDKANGVGSGFITATIENRDVMLVTLPVYSKEEEKEKGVLHLWLTDNTHIVDIGPVSGDDDAAASSLLYKSAGSGNNNNERLIALYEKKKGGGESSLGMVSVRLTAQLKHVREVLATWKKVDGRVSKLCPSTAATNPSTGNGCSTVKITAGLVGFFSGKFSGNTWRDEYLGVDATVKSGVGVEKTKNGVTFKGRGAWAEWPVGSQGQNQLYHFANNKFTLVATVSIHKVPEEGSPIPLIGVGINDAENPVLLGLSYNKEKKWRRMCSGEPNFKEHSNSWEPDTTYQVAIVLQNGSQGSVYVDGERVGSVQCELKKAELKKVSHFSIGGDGRSADKTGRQDISLTVRNVLLYNRPLTSEEIDALNPNKASIPPPVNTLVQGTVSPSTPGGQKPTGQESLRGVTGKNGRTAGGKDVQGEEGIHSQDREVNATALNSSLGKLSQENNSDGGTMRGSGLLPLLLLLLGMWGFAAL